MHYHIRRCSFAVLKMYLCITLSEFSICVHNLKCHSTSFNILKVFPEVNSLDDISSDLENAYTVDFQIYCERFVSENSF